jgi:hypothetical protein
MKIKLTKSKFLQQTKGYEMVSENEEDEKILSKIRDMHFWGLSGNVIEYDGYKSDKKRPKQPIIGLVFTKKKYTEKFNQDEKEQD